MIYMLLDKVIEPSNKVGIIITSSHDKLYHDIELDKLVDFTHDLDDDSISHVFKSYKLTN